MSARMAYLLALMTCVAGPLAAQEKADTSLAARLERAERMIQVLQQQMAEQAKARVTPREGNKVELSGTVLLNGFYNNAKVNSEDAPSIVLPPDLPGGLPASALGGTARQSELDFTVTSPQVLGASFTGELNVDFYGGQQNFARLFPLLHLKRTKAELRWPHAWVLFGQEAPPISSLNPSSFSARSIPGFTNAGNLWFWIPQVRVGADAGGRLKIGVEAAALAPMSLETPTSFQPDANRAERSRRPSVEARVIAKWEQGDMTGEVGVGGHYGWFSTVVADSFIVSRALAATARISPTRFVELRAEAFMGQALASLGGGGIGQDLGPGDVPVHTKGGWAQLNLMPRTEVELGGGIGLDDPDNADLDINTARLLNVSYEGHLHLKPGPLILAVEFRRVETTYGPRGKLFVNHFNVGMGFRF
jgi:hypothetical protein